MLSKEPLIHLLFVVGTRPNFMKVAPLLRACKKFPKITTSLVHTGQHYDDTMSKIFFEELEIDKPDLMLRAGEFTDPIVQKEYIRDEIFEQYKDKNLSLIIVVGDVNSTVGGALAGEKLGVPVAHVEAGLRSFDNRMPEEHNRIAVDTIASLYFVTEPSGMKNLQQPIFQLSRKKAFLVGNVMIDSLVHAMPRINAIQTPRKFGLEKKSYVVVTLHRKENLEERTIATRLTAMIEEISTKKRIVWPMHPRTRKELANFGLLERIEANKKILIVAPLGYLELISLIKDALCLVTDSGGIQDESTYLSVPCLTIRRTTERPITTTVGSSTLVGEDMDKLRRLFTRVCNNTYKKSRVPMFWDGKTSERIIKIIERELAN